MTTFDRAPRAPFGLLVASLALVAAACGSGTASQGPGTPAPGSTQPAVAQTSGPGSGATGGATAYPCSLLTAEDIKAVTGFGVERSSIARSPETNLGDLDASCEWELDNAGETGWGVVVGFKVTGGRAYYDAFHDGTPLEGVGDAAVQEEVLVVRAVKGDTMFIVTYFQFPEPEGIAAQLARAIADNL